MSRNNGKGTRVELRLDLPRSRVANNNPNNNNNRALSSGSSSSSSSSPSTSPPSSCVSSDSENASSPEASSMVLVGCPRCLMYVMLSESDPRCPKCKSTVLLDFQAGSNSNNSKNKGKKAR